MLQVFPVTDGIWCVTSVLLTHWHNDHSAGAAELKRRLGVSVCYAADEQPFLTRETATVGFRAWLGERIPELGVLVLLRGLLEEAAPAAVQADTLVRDHDVVAGGFRVLASPGHTPDHVAYFHEPSRALFCGDALAVIGDRIRLMARPVTPDVPAARASAARCLTVDPLFICPGHREPLRTGVAAEVSRMRAFLASDATWPILG